MEEYSIILKKAFKLGELIGKLESKNKQYSMKKWIQGNPQRFFVHIKDLICISNKINEKAILLLMSPVIFTGEDLENEFNLEEFKSYLWEGYNNYLLTCNKKIINLI